MERGHAAAGLLYDAEREKIVLVEQFRVGDYLTGEYRQPFMLHYNFPPFSVGETGRIGSPGRREIGHGKLAWRAIHPMLPSKEEFPYSIRVVSEIMESNGSSSMATVCGSCLSLMDAGVPMKHPVAGIAMGLIKEDDGAFVSVFFFEIVDEIFNAELFAELFASPAERRLGKECRL